MINLVITRHFNTAWSKDRRLQGRKDLPLLSSPVSYKIPDTFQTYDVVSSPLLRATQTAALLSDTPSTLHEALIEMDFGTWEGLTVHDIDPAAQALGLQMTPPNGESPLMVMDRLRPWIHSLKKDTFAITHKGVIRALIALATGWDMKEKFLPTLQPTTCHHFTVVDGLLRLKELNIPLKRGYP